MARPLKAIVIGTNIGCAKHVAGLRGGGFEVTGLLGRDPARTAERAAALGIPTAFSSLEAALDTDADAVVVATPPETHHALTLAAIGAGKHVLCEKPFALDLAAAVEMRDAVQAAGLVGQVVHQLRWFEVPCAVRSLVAAGELGRPIQGTFLFDHVTAARGVGRLPDWWLHRERGGGWLQNFASHGIDLVRFMLGEFEAVAATLHADAGRGMSSDDSYSLVFHLAGGMQGTMTGTCRARDALDFSRIVGERATVSFDGKAGAVTDDEGVRPLTAVADGAQALTLAFGDKPVVHDPKHGAAELAAMCRAFHDRIHDPAYRHPSVATFEDGVRHVAVIAAVLEAARSGRWIEIRT